MKDDEYEILPHTELEYLRREVEKLKRNPLGDTQASIGLLDGINKLNTNVEMLVKILQSANDEMVKAYTDQTFQEQVRRIRQENAKIAHGIVAIAEMVKALEQQQGKMLPQFEDFLKETAQANIPPPQAPSIPIPPAPDAAQAPVEDMRPRNPFDEPGRRFQPILNSPLPRPGVQGIPDDEIPPPPPGA